MNFNHIPVLLEEVIDGLNIKPNGIYVDGTLGGAGHSIKIAKKLKKGRLIGVDQDINALKKAEKVLEDYRDKVTLVHDNYKNIDLILDNLNIEKVDGVLLDIGVSSHQLDEGSRGFSYHEDARLDMRMDRRQELTAWDVINKYDKKTLDHILREYGEEKWSSRISDFIVKERKLKSIDTTLDLVRIIDKAIPKAVRREMGHPARKSFQAIRIEVNKELDVLEHGIYKIVERLNSKGRLNIITFHSLEDRIVKNVFKELFKTCICPSEIPICVCDKEREIDIITRRPIIPSKEEVKRNVRSRSAKLRIAEKL